MDENNKTSRRTSLYEFNQKYGDPWIWGIFMALIVISIVENYSASSREVARMGIYMPILKQGFFLLTGTVVTTLIAKRDYNKTSFLACAIPLLAIVTVGMLVYVLFFGRVINGAQRAIDFRIFTVQPSELAKLSITTLMAYILAVYQKDKGLTIRGLAWATGAIALYCGLMIRSGFTNCAIVGAVCVTMLLIGGAKFKHVFIVGMIGAMVGGGLMLLRSMGAHNDTVLQDAEQEVTATVQDGEGNAPAAVTIDENKDKEDAPKVDRSRMRYNRIKNWWNNDSLVYWPVTSENQQEVFSRMAQAHGGIMGVGLGRSRECSRLPLAFSDYIYSIIIEETGLMGGIFVMLLYLSLLGRAFIIVRRCNRALPSLLIIGLASLITYQALVHMAINTGVFPVSGQPLPLISNGGTAIWSICIAFGIMLSVSRTIAVNKTAAAQAATEPELPAGLDAENPLSFEEPLAKNIWK